MTEGFFLFLLFIVCVVVSFMYLCVCVDMCHCAGVRIRECFNELALAFHHESRDETQAIRLGGRSPSPLSHLIGQLEFFFLW